MITFFFQVLILTAFLNSVTLNASKKTEEYKISLDKRAIRDDILNDAPDLCRIHIDAITRFKNELLIFKGQWFWKLDENGKIVDGKTSEPQLITDYWKQLPKDLSQIDAVLYVVELNRILFFIGKQFWSLDPDRHNEADGIAEVINLSDIAIELVQVQAAWRRERNKKIYLFRGFHYWRFRIKNGNFQRDLDVSRSYQLWDGMPQGLDAAYTDGRGLPIFIKGNNYWLLDDLNMVVPKGYPKNVSRLLPPCGGEPYNVSVETSLDQTVASYSITISLNLSGSWIMLLMWGFHFMSSV